MWPAFSATWWTLGEFCNCMNILRIYYQENSCLLWRGSNIGHEHSATHGVACTTCMVMYPFYPELRWGLRPLSRLQGDFGRSMVVLGNCQKPRAFPWCFCVGWLVCPSVQLIDMEVSFENTHLSLCMTVGLNPPFFSEDHSTMPCWQATSHPPDWFAKVSLLCTLIVSCCVERSTLCLLFGHLLGWSHFHHFPMFFVFQSLMTTRRSLLVLGWCWQIWTW